MKDKDRKSQSPFERFKQLAKGIVAVPKKEAEIQTTVLLPFHGGTEGHQTRRRDGTV